MTKTVESKVINAISASTGIPESSITSGQSFEDLGFTSILAVQLLSKLEKQFGIEAAPNETSHITTVGEFVDYFKNRVQ